MHDDLIAALEWAVGQAQGCQADEVFVLGQLLADLRACNLVRRGDVVARDSALAERVYKAGHLAGWHDNQYGRDVQHVAAAKEWAFYVSDGALAKSIEAADAIAAGAHGGEGEG